MLVNKISSIGFQTFCQLVCPLGIISVLKYSQILLLNIFNKIQVGSFKIQVGSFNQSGHPSACHLLLDTQFLKALVFLLPFIHHLSFHCAYYLLDNILQFLPERTKGILSWFMLSLFLNSLNCTQGASLPIVLCWSICNFLHRIPI